MPIDLYKKTRIARLTAEIWLAKQHAPTHCCEVRKTIFFRSLCFFFAYLMVRGKNAIPPRCSTGNTVSFSGIFLNLTTEFLGRRPQNRPKTKNSNRYNSIPETDFITIPTAFRNVTGGLKKPLKIFHQGRRKGLNSKMCHAPKNFKPHFLKICKIDFL